ncbi:MAG: putative minor tail protein [Prokaryotic dsDNA virus sp.]|nr:MAG: putative minor tail protein [Prokaryotic dsDNA virus sp.]
MGAGADLIIRIATKGAKLASTQMDKLGNSSALAGGKLGKFAKVGATAVAGALLAIGKGVAESVQAFTSFEDKLTQSVAIMDTTIGQQERMAKVARDVATETTISAEASAEAFFFLASAGLNAEQSIQALPQVARFAQAGMFDMATATDLATDAQSALGLTVDDATLNLQNLTKVTDVLVKANTLANATVQQFSEALTNKAGAALKVVNKDIEEGVAVLAAFADRGVKGAEAGEKLNQILRDIPRATAKNKKEFDALGLELFDTEGNMKNVADVIEELDRVLAPMSDELKASTLDQLGLNRGVADAVKILSGAGDEIRNYESELNSAFGTTQAVAEKQLESFKSQMEILRNTLTNLAIIVGEDVVPALEKMISFFQTTTERILKFKESQDNAEGSSKKFKLAVIGLVAVLAPLAPIATAVGIGIAGIVKIIGKGNEKFKKQEELGKRVNNVFERMQNQFENTERSAENFSDTSLSLEEILDGTNFTVDELTALLDSNGIALNDNAKEALKTAQAYEDSLLGGMQSVVDALDRMESIQDRITNAEKNRNKALEQQFKAEKEVQKATENLDKAKQHLASVQGLGAKVTAEEQLAIERQRETIKQLQEQENKSTIQKLELQVAEQKLAELIAESTALSREEEQALREVEQAEADLTRAEDLRTLAIEKVTEAQKQLNKVSEQNFRNTLEQAIAQEQLTKALESFGEGTKGYEDALKKMSKITGIEISKLMSEFDKLFDKSSRIGLTPSKSAESETTSPADDSGSVKFPATGDVVPEFGKDSALARFGTTNVITVNTGQSLSTAADVEEAVAKALQEGARRGINVVF